MFYLDCLDNITDFEETKSILLKKKFNYKRIRKIIFS